MILKQPQQLLSILFELRHLAAENIQTSSNALKNGCFEVYEHNRGLPNLMRYFDENVKNEKQYIQWLDRIISHVIKTQKQAL